MGLSNYFRLLRMQAPALLYFDHIYSEYQTIKKNIEAVEADAVKYIDNDLVAKRQDKSLTWNDLYYFELILANFQPIEKLRSKIVRLRHDYQSVAGQRDFDNYITSKPPDLQSPPDLSAPPPTQLQYENLLREDLKDLLGRLYMRYAILPVKETRLNILTWVAAGLCLFFLLVLLFFIVFLHTGGFKAIWTPDVKNIQKNLATLTILVVVVTGAMGGFVSALQRIQSPPTEGDSLYNLSLLFYGSYSVFIAPISGAIFAILLYLMFTSHVLQGSFFPTIYTPAASYAASSAQAEEETSKISPTPSSSSSIVANTNKSSAVNPPVEQINANSADNPTPIPRTSSPPPPAAASSPFGSATLAPIPQKSMYIIDFLSQSGPAGGTDYALLIIWCFIAGFAERFVPDALDRLISGASSAGTGKS